MQMALFILFAVVGFIAVVAYLNSDLPPMKVIWWWRRTVCRVIGHKWHYWKYSPGSRFCWRCMVEESAGNALATPENMKRWGDAQSRQ